MQGFTAYLTEPYYTEPDNYGIPGMTSDEFRDRALYAHTHGFQLAIHCNGDAALDVALNTVEWLLEVHPRADHRHRIEHCQTPRPDQLELLKKLGMVANFFVAHTHVCTRAASQFERGRMSTGAVLSPS
jgi:predicted amidohydrolase YtcJ